MRVTLTEEQFKNYVKYQIIKENGYLNENRFGKLGKAFAGGLLGAGLALGGTSCQNGYNEPDYPGTETRVDKQFTPHNYPVGDMMGNSANAFKNFYNNCDWSKCAEGDGYVYGYESAGCHKNAWSINVAMPNKKDGYYQYLMYNPTDKEKLPVGSKISAEYLRNNCQLQVIFTVNCMTPDGEIVVDYGEVNCPYTNK